MKRDKENDEKNTNTQNKLNYKKKIMKCLSYLHTFSHLYENYIKRGQFKMANVLPIFL